jgi:tRNA dimethylallyltransferase
MRSATERYSAHQWATDAEAWMREAREEGHPSVIVGGTGFYVRALVQPLHGAPPLDADRRRALEEVLADFPAGRLARWCARLDPARALLGPTQQRRAVETALLAGVRLSDVHRGAGHAESAPRQHSATESRAVRYLVVDPGPVLAERIRARVHAMVDAGWFEEVESLMGHIPPDAPAWNACGYGTMRAAVRGELARDAAIERVVIETRQYAKRQRTWCRHQLVEGPVTRIDPDAPGAYERVLAWWNHNGAEDA